MNLLSRVIAAYPALARGDMVDDPGAVKRAEQVNTAVRTLLAAAVTLVVLLGWLPEGTQVEQVVMVLSGLYVTASSLWTFVSNIVTTRKLGVEIPPADTPPTV